MSKSVFYWASIAGSRYEPVEVTKENGKRLARTIGCPDTFDLGAADCLCVLDPDGPMDRPEGPYTPAQEKRRERDALRRAEELRAHRWRGPR